MPAGGLINGPGIPLTCNHYIRQDGTWLDDKQMMSFLLRWDVVPAERATPVLDHLLSVYPQSGVEMNTYYPLEFYRYGKPEQAYALLVRLMAPELKRREYPEVSLPSWKPSPWG